MIALWWFAIWITIGSFVLIHDKIATNRKPAVKAVPAGDPAPRSSAMCVEVWRDFQADRISLVSALLRIEALFAARVAEVEDWDALDWTISELAPTQSRYGWEGDRLVEKDPVETYEDAILSAYAFPPPSTGRILPMDSKDYMAVTRPGAFLPHALPPNARIVSARMLPETHGGRLGYVRQYMIEERIDPLAAEREILGRPLFVQPDLDFEYR